MNPRRILLSTEDRRVIDDSRMSVERPFVRDWNLLIRHVSVNDNGEYTCQINTDPIQIKRIRLTVHGKYPYLRQRTIVLEECKAPTD